MRNTIRVVCNPYTNQISYYFKNELDEWIVLSGNSPLSRKDYTNTSMQDSADSIIEKIDEIYNRKNKGLDILFEGTDEAFDTLKKAVKDKCQNRDIVCKLGTTKIAVVGKKCVGKTSLIEGLEELHGYKYSEKQKTGYTVYADECNHAEWYEIDGIDLGISEIEKARATIKNLEKEGVTAVIYCISATTGKIEESEVKFIAQIEKEFAKLTVMVALTMCYKDDSVIKDIYDSIKKATDQITIVSTLAKSFKTANKDDIEPFGVKNVSKFVFEGR